MVKLATKSIMKQAVDTLLNGVGGYERRQTNVLYVVVPQNQLARIKRSSMRTILTLS